MIFKKILFPVIYILKEEALASLSYFVKFAKTFKWVETFPELKEKKGVNVIGPFDVMYLDMANVYERLDATKAGLIPALAASSKGNIGSESFDERMFSSANDVSMKGNTRL